MKDPVLRTVSLRYTTRVLPSDHVIRNMCKHCKVNKLHECDDEMKRVCMFNKGNPIPRHRWRDVLASAYPKRKITAKSLRSRQLNKVKRE